MNLPVSDNLIINEETLPLITQLAEKIPGGFFIYHADGDQELIYFNSHLVSLFGCGSEDEFRALTGNSFRGIVHPDDYAQSESSIKEQIGSDDKKIDHIKYRYIRRDGSVGLLDDYGHFSRSESYGDIYYVFVQDLTKEYLEEQKAAQTELLRQMLDYDGVFLIDCVNDTRRTLHDRLSGAENYDDAENYSSAFARYVENFVCEPDREMMSGFISPAGILDLLGERKDMSVTYRDRTTGTQRFYEMRIIRFSDTEVLQSFRDNDAEIVNRLLFSRLEDNYFALFGVDLESGLLRSFKDDPLHVVGGEGEVSSYSAVMLRLASFFEGESKAFFEKYSDARNVKQAFAVEDRAERIIRSASGEGSGWVDISGIVLERGADGLPSLFCLAFNYLDEDSARMQDLKDQLKGALDEAEAANRAKTSFVNSFKALYQVMYYIDLKQGRADFLYGDEEAKKFMLIFNTDSPEKMFENFKKYYVEAAVIPEDRERLLGMMNVENMYRTLRTKNSMSVNYRVRRNLVDPVYTEMSIIRAEEEDGELSAVIMAFRMTDEELREALELRRQLKDALDEAQAASRAKTEFLFNMSHDVRTPMNAILGFTNMAQKHLGSREKVSDYLAKIDTSGKQLLELINQVLEMSRIETGKTEFSETPVNIPEQFSASVTVLAEQAGDKGLEFHYSLSDIVHQNVFADTAKMSSITLNITGNAIKYTPCGGRIDYSLREIPPRRPGYATYVFTVADTGIGMSGEFLSRLYEPFTREQNSTVSRVQGTGLGMSIVRNIVDLMGGTIEVQSEPGRGTRFDVTLDLRIDQDAERKPEEQQPDAVLFAGRKALLVEDNEMNREIAEEILEEEGLKVETAEDGSIAVEMLREKGPDCYDFILMDIQMPIMNGYEATKTIRAMYPDAKLPIIAVSANAFEEDKKMSLESGMNDHVAKPININELFNSLAKFL